MVMDARSNRGLALVLVGLVGLIAASGCNKPKKVILTKEQQRRIDESILKEAPKPTVAIDANLDGKVKLIGVDVPKTLTPGKPATITYYWEATGDTAGDWKVFVHLERPGQKRQILDHHAVSELYPMNEWKKGQVVKDEQQFTVDGGFTNGDAVLWVGVFNEKAWREKQANQRMVVVNKDKVKTDGDNRIEAAHMEVVGGAKSPAAGAAATRPPFYAVRKVSNFAVKPDGKLDEEVWKSAPQTRAFLRPDGKPMSPALRTTARLLYDDTNLYVAFEVKDQDVRSTKTDRDDPLWEQDVVEVYLDPGSDGKRYVELQVSPKNVVFDAMFDSHRSPKWEDAAKRATIPMVTAVDVQGLVNDPSADQGWTVEMAIPFRALPDVTETPKPGTTWTMNLYRIDEKGARNMEFQGAWAPVGGDFHDLSKAGKISFAAMAPDGAAKPAEGAAKPAEGAAKPAEGAATPTPAKDAPAAPAPEAGTPAQK